MIAWSIWERHRAVKRKDWFFILLHVALSEFWKCFYKSDKYEWFVLVTIVEAAEEEMVKQKRKVWVYEINTEKLIFGEHHHLLPDLLRDWKKFLKYFRMSRKKFYQFAMSPGNR